MEKPDVMFENLYKISAKTLIPNNKELNIGSFSAEALFKDFLDYVPQERTHLGSKTALQKIFDEVKEKGGWLLFLNHFKEMIDFIFDYDLIIAIKNDNILQLYVIPSNEFRELIKNSLDYDLNTEEAILNRFESHALRVKVEPILNNAQNIDVILKGPSSIKLEKIDNLLNSLKLKLFKIISNGKKSNQVLNEMINEIKQYFDI